jgi:hypothetical protein
MRYEFWFALRVSVPDPAAVRMPAAWATVRSELGTVRSGREAG